MFAQPLAPLSRPLPHLLPVAARAFPRSSRPVTSPLKVDGYKSYGTSMLPISTTRDVQRHDSDRGAWTCPELKLTRASTATFSTVRSLPVSSRSRLFVDSRTLHTSTDDGASIVVSCPLASWNTNATYAPLACRRSFLSSRYKSNGGKTRRRPPTAPNFSAVADRFPKKSFDEGQTSETKKKRERERDRKRENETPTSAPRYNERVFVNPALVSRVVTREKRTRDYAHT